MAEKKNSEKKKTKAQQAIGKTAEEKRTETRNKLVLRLVGGILLAFFALFLLLSMFGIHAALLDLFRDAARGLLGYGYWLLPWAFGMIAWLLVFQNHKPALLRSIAILLVVALFSGLLHGLLCRITFDEHIISSLWRTGIDGASGGLLPGLLAQGLIFCFSRGGAVPVMLVLLIICFFIAFQISAAQLLHKKADKRREKLKAQEPEEVPEPIILTHEDTMEDLRILATPPVIKRPELRLPIKRQESFDIPVDEEVDLGETLSGETEEEEDLVFFGSKKKKQKKEKSEKKTANAFDVPVGQDYTAQVQELVASGELEEDQEPMELPWEPPQPITANIPAQTTEKPETLTEAELTEAAKEAMKDGKVSKDEAALAAAQVAMEIEAKTDQEAQEAPVYQYPPMTMLQEAMSAKEDNTEEMRTNVVKLEATLKSFGVDIKIENVVRGPTVTRYEMELKPGVKMNKITSLHEDIALALGVSGIRVAAVPGKSSIIGIEVPNKITTSVPIREVLSSKEFRNHKSNLAFAVGKDIGGNYIIGDIAKMPHLLIAGTTGSGKSVCMNSIIVSLLYRATPEQVRLIMIDPKVVELSIYNGIPHLLIPVVTDAKKAAGALQWAVTEMERRYKLLADYKVRDLSGYNKLAQSDPNMAPMPQIVVIIDELADLMLVAAKEVENSIVRIAQKARAAGMYLVIATQRPSSDVITGLMKANIPSRIAFAVASAIDSRIILDESGAEKLVGKGDMLYGPLGSGKPKRVQGCFITDEEVEEVAEFVKSSSDSDYSDEILKEIEQNASASSSGGGKADSDGDQLALDMEGDPQLPDAVEVILDTKQASVSMLQRRLKLGYAHAARIVDEMEEKGIVGPFEGSKPRQLLITREQWDTMVGINPKAKAPEASQAEAQEDADEPPFDL
jgi:S-DNA-T family DNA segregation ATPase FtsK/SpoIIIE